MIEFRIEGATDEHQLVSARNAFAALKARKDLGYLSLPFQDENWHISNTIVEKLRNKTEKLVVIGMGGSALGGKALVDSLGTNNVEFLYNTDPRTVSRFLDNDVTIEKSQFLVISKSGNTLEVATILSLLTDKLLKAGRELADSITIITEKTKNPLCTFAEKNKIEVVPHPLDVGGRFSVFSPVGLIPAAFSGLDLGKLRNGVLQAFEDSESLVQLAVACRESFERRESITVFWSYIDRIAPVFPWLGQLWAESLGKKNKRKSKEMPSVSTPMFATGACDQHSLLQQFMDGQNDKMFLFISENDPRPVLQVGGNFLSGFEYLKSKTLSEIYTAQSMATQEALKQVGRSTARLKLHSIDEESVGQLMMMFELLIGVLGEMLDINAFDQPGVEIGKKIAKEKLS